MEEGPTLVIAEKPSTARSLARALASISGNRPRVMKRERIQSYEVIVEGRLHIVSPAAGHLYGLAQKNSGWKYPVFDIEWKPSWKINKSSSHTRAYLENFMELGKRCSSFISATDFDREGSVIAYNILRLACGVETGKRMKFSTLTTPDLVRAYRDASPKLDLGQIQAGLARHVLDWYWGVNMTRALTLAMKPHRKGFGILSTGRVQGPTLKILSDLELEISRFVPRKFWTIEILCRHEGSEFTAVGDPERIWDEKEAIDAFGELSPHRGEHATVAKSNRKVSSLPPPPPFDLTTLQTEAYRHFGFSPTRTLAIAQSLYESALISYPRTSSQKIPPTLGYRNIITQVSKQEVYAPICERLLAVPKLRPREGTKSDPAHPAIYPTGSVPGRLRPEQRRVYDLVCRRFLTAFAPAAKRESVSVVLDFAGFPFRCSGRRVLDTGWSDFYGPYAKLEESPLPHLVEGEEVDVLDIMKQERETQPPKRFTQASIIREMERRGLGTKATRASIVQTLYDRGYIRGKSIEVTELGLSVAETLSKHCPGVVSESLTAKFERHMEEIEEGKVSMESVVEEAKRTLTDILTSFKKKEEEIGRELAKAAMETRKKEREIGPCPRCGGTLRFVTSKRTGKRFIGCSGYSEGCRFSAPLPQTGKLMVSRQRCKACGQPLITVYRSGKRPWTLCFNPECPLKKKEEKGNEGREKQQPKEA